MEFNEQLALQLLESDVEFPVDFDDAWNWLEYSRKDVAKRSLLNCGFTEGIDFLISADATTTGISSNPKENIFLTLDCFKQWCMMSGTEKGKDVRLYFLKCEKVLKERIKAEQSLTQSDLANQLANFINEQRNTTKLLMERTVKLDKIEEASQVHKGCADVLEGEMEGYYDEDDKYTAKEYLDMKKVSSEHLPTLRKRAAQFVRMGQFGVPSRNSKSQTVYVGNQILYLDSALRTILDL